MNLYGFATGTNAYSLNVSERETLRPGDIVTVAFLNDNTGASTLSVNGGAAYPLLRNSSAMSSGDLVALTLYQFCFTGASFLQDVQAAAGATTDASLLTSGTLAEARLPNNINATHIADGSISNTEFQRLNNVSSNIQDQLDAIVTSVSSEASTRAAADSGLTSSLAGKANTSHTHSGADITTGTVPVAAIPTAIPATSIANGTVDNTEFQALNGITSNIQNQLDNKQPIATGTPDGTKFYADDGSWKNVSATDSTKLPLAGGTMTGALKMSGTVNIDAASMEMYPAGSGLLYRNVPTGGLYGECVNGAEVYQLGASGIAFPYAHSTPGTNVVGVYRDGSGNLCLGVGSGAGLIAKVAGSRAGGFPLTPSDMPTQYALEAVASSQTLNTSDYKTILYDTPGVNTGPAWSYSSGTWTCLIAGVYDIDAIIYAASSVVVELYINKNGTRRYGGSAVICSSAPSVRKTISFGSGDTFYIEAYAAGTGPALDVSIVGLRDIFVNRRT